MMTQPETGPGSHLEKTTLRIICEGISGEKLDKCDTFKIPCQHTGMEHSMTEITQLGSQFKDSVKDVIIEPPLTFCLLRWDGLV